MAKSHAELQEELKRLKAELQRKQLEEQIRLLQSQIEQTALQAAIPPPSNSVPDTTTEDNAKANVEDTNNNVETEEIASPSTPVKLRQKWQPKPKQDITKAPASPVNKLAPARLAALTTPSSPPPPPPELPPLPPFTPRVLPKYVEAAEEETATPMETWLGRKLYHSGKLLACSTRSGTDTVEFVLLYIGAKGNRDCNNFLPRLLDFYKMANRDNTFVLECVYASRDRNMVGFREAFAKMPWLSMPPGTAHLKNRLTQEWKIIDQPAVIVFEPKSGHVITTEAVEQIAQLERRKMDQVTALLQYWRSCPTKTPDEIEFDTRLKHGTMQRGTLYWQE